MSVDGKAFDHDEAGGAEPLSTLSWRPRQGLLIGQNAVATDTATYPSNNILFFRPGFIFTVFESVNRTQREQIHVS